METSESPNLKKFIYILSHRKWLVIFPFVIVSSLIITIGAYLPKVYQATTTILYEPLGVSRDFVRPMLETPMQNRLQHLSKEILSRSRIKQIIHEFQLDREINDAIALEGLIIGMQGMIAVDISRNEAVKISCSGRDPLLITQITNRIASLFIDEQQRNSQHQAEVATLFLDRELDKVDKQMKAQEDILQEFRQEHLGELPEQEDLNLRALDHLQMQLQSAEQTLISAQEQELFLERQLSSLSPAFAGEEDNYSPHAGYIRLEQLKNELAGLKLKYSDQWPEVKRINRQITKLEQKLESAPPASQPENTIAHITNDPASQELAGRLTNLRRRIASLKENQKQLLKDIKKYNRRIDNLPQIKQEMSGLIENYNMLKSNYEALRSKKLDAKLSENFQSAREDGYFRVLDPAEVPLIPIKPKMMQILILAIFVGLGGGVGLVVVRDYMNNSLINSDEAERYLNLPVIGLIPSIKTSQDVRQAKIRNVQYAFLLCLYLVFIGLLLKHRKPIKSFVFTHNTPQNTTDGS